MHRKESVILMPIAFIIEGFRETGVMEDIPQNISETIELLDEQIADFIDDETDRMHRESTERN